MKRTLITLVLAAIILGTFCAAAEIDGDYEFSVSANGESYIWLYMGSDASVTVPNELTASYDEVPFPVIEISDKAFIYNDDLQTLIVSEGIENIGYRAFYGCENLETVILPSSLREIRDEAFMNCTSLKQIVLPDKLHFAGGNIFYGCDALQLSQKDMDVLTNTEVAEQEAQQAVFVVDTENLTDLSVYLGTDLEGFLTLMGNMEDLGYTDGIGYANNDVTVTADYGDEKEYIYYIELTQKSNYSLLGIYVSMNIRDAKQKVLKMGWTPSGTYGDCIHFDDPNENTLTCRIDANGTITNVAITVDYDIRWAIGDGTGNAADVFAY